MPTIEPLEARAPAPAGPPRSDVMTVTGPIDASQIGFTLPHEHTYCQLWMAHHRFDFPNQLEDDDVFADELRVFKAQGGTCLVDLTLREIGRKPEKLRQLSMATGVAVVMGCGWYREGYYLPEDRLDRRPVAELADELLNEIREGVGTSGIRPGVIGEIGAERKELGLLRQRSAFIAQRRGLSARPDYPSPHTA